MTQSIASDLERDKDVLEAAYFRNMEIDKQLGFSSSLISDINQKRRRQRKILFIVFLCLLMLIFCFPFLRHRLSDFFVSHWNANQTGQGVPTVVSNPPNNNDPLSDPKSLLR